jgi:putative transposase
MILVLCGVRKEGGNMSKRKYSEVEMIGALKQMEAGRTAADVGRELGVSKHTVYAWKAKFGGMSVSEAQRLRQLEDENGAGGAAFEAELSGGVAVGVAFTGARPFVVFRRVGLSFPAVRVPRIFLLSLAFRALSHRIDAYQSEFHFRVERETTPWPIFRVCHQSALHRIHVHVL